VPLFGATFDVLDLLMYVLGVAGAVAFERTVVSRLGAGAGGGASRDAPQPD